MSPISIATMFSLPGYAEDVPGVPLADTTANGLAQVPTIPPVVWMFIFLVIGYVGLRMLMED